jgi:serine/threonine-protein kinase HipA
MTNLHVLMGGYAIGRLDGDAKHLRLLYEQDAVAQPGFVPLSLSMPGTQLRWQAGRIRNWIEGLLPDRPGVLQQWRAGFGIQDPRPESLLAHVGEDLAGAVQFVRSDRLESVTTDPGSVEPVTESEIAGIVRAAIRDSLPDDAATATGRFSLAGAQAKFALQRTATGWALPAGAQPSTPLFKPAIPGLGDQDVTEVVTMRTAAELGLPTAHAFSAEFAGERVIGVERYDRVAVDGLWYRIHQEDLCQAAGVNPMFKYEAQGGPSAATCAEIIRSHCGENDVGAFARAVIFNYLVRGSDAHARNYSILLTPGEARLAPLYDLNSTMTFGEQWATRASMRIGGEDRLDHINSRNWNQFASDVGVAPGWVRAELGGLAAHLPDAMAAVRSQPDMAGLAPRTTALLQDRAAAWCQAALKRLS